ncbi:MAG TPA: hypothetical protein VL137_06715 [Polyangiaceae bacterium]|nr:hypothetical protein [Polyangiaceae bacterium]
MRSLFFSRLVVGLNIGATAVCLCSCSRKLVVEDVNGSTGGATAQQVSTGGTSTASSGAAQNMGGASVVGVAGASPGAGATGPRSNNGNSGNPVPLVDGGTVQHVNLSSSVDQAKDASGSLVTSVQVLADALTSVELPAVGDDGVSLVQYLSTTHADVLHVDWNGVQTQWYQSGNAYYIYTGASGSHHLGTLQSTALYPIHEDGGEMDVSGTPTTFKEFLAVNGQGFAWVNYPQRAMHIPPVGGQTMADLGEVVFQTFTGTRTILTDNLRYRNRIDLSATDLAFVEYADTNPGTVGQIGVQPLTGGAEVIAAPSANHQDRPAIDGDWVVWEEYLNTTDSVIRGRNLVTGEVRDLSGTSGFRTNPDIRGTRVVWEDQRGSDSDIYMIDLADGQPERIVISGTGYSTGARLTADGLVWIEIVGSDIGLLSATFAQ